MTRLLAALLVAIPVFVQAQCYCQQGGMWTSTQAGIASLSADVLGTATGTGVLLDAYPSGFTIGSGGACSGISWAAHTIQLTGNSNTIVGVEGLNFQPTIKNDTSARTLGGFSILYGRPVINADTSAFTLSNGVAGLGPSAAAVFWQPQFGRAAGTPNSTAADVFAVDAGAGVGAGWTATLLGGLKMRNPTIGGAITDLWAVDVDALSGATTTGAIRSAITANSARYFLRDTGGAQSTILGSVRIGSTSAPVAQEQVTQATIANEVTRQEAGAAGAPLPSKRLYFQRATCAASATTNIDFNLTANAPTEAPCPSGTVCYVETHVTCHCTSGSACTGDGGAALLTTWLVKNSGGTLTQIGSTASGFLLGQSVASLTSTYVSSGSAFITSITQSITGTTSIREAIVMPVNANMTCAVSYSVEPVGT